MSNAESGVGELGLLDELSKVSGRPSAMQRFDDAGESLGQLDIRALERSMGHGAYSVLRRDLRRVLLARVGALGIPVTYGRNGRAIDDAQGRPRLHFDDGEPVSADLLIGAEGRMHSVARRYVTEESAPVYQGFSNWVGIAESPTPLVNDTAILDFWGVGLRFGIVPISATQVYFAAGRREPLEAKVQQRDSSDELHAVFGGWPAVVRRVLESSLSPSVRKIFVHDQEPIACWLQGAA